MNRRPAPRRRARDLVVFVANDVTALSVALPQVEQDFDSDVTTSGYLAARLDKPVLEDLRGL